MTEAATVKCSPAEIDRYDEKAKIAVWEGLTALANTGAAYVTPSYEGRTVEVCGNFGADGALVIEGSIGGERWYPVSDEIEEPQLFTLRSSVRHTRPRVLRGDKDTKLTVTAMFRRIL